MSEVNRTSDKPICPLCDQRIYGGCICISVEYAMRIAELEAVCSEENEGNIELNKYIAELEAKLEGMNLAYEICKDPALKPCNHQWRKVTGQEWLKCMECGVVRD